MSTKFNLEKAVQQTRFILDKKGIDPKLKAQVAIVLDVSGSTRELFEGGDMQEAMQRTLPIAIQFDDNQELDVFTFHGGMSSVTHIGDNATAANYSNYIQKKVLNDDLVSKWGGTDYSPVMWQLLEEFGFYTPATRGTPAVPAIPAVPAKKGFLGIGATPEIPGKPGKPAVPAGPEKWSKLSATGYPAVIYFLTDGENTDKPQTEALLKKLQELGIQVYFNFIGVGHEKFLFLKKIGDKFDNTAFTSITDIKEAANDSIYELLLPDELTTWLHASR